MIKQSEICNFVSLIKSLKKQISNPKPDKCADSRGIASFTKNNYTAASHCNRIIINKENIFEISRNSIQGAEDSFRDLRAEKRPQFLRRKKMYQIYCEEKKKQFHQRQCASIHKFRQLGCEGLSFVRYSKTPHKRSSTSQLTSQKKATLNVSEPILPQKGLKTLQNSSRSKQRTQHRRNWQKNLSQTWMFRPQFETFFKNEEQPPNLRRKARMSLERQQPETKIPRQIRDCWVIDAWEQPADLEDLF